MSGYSHERVRQFVQAAGTVRASDGRVMRLNHRALPESYRNTLANWLARGASVVPLGRWDELLLSVGMMLWEYEQWELETFGNLSYTQGDPEPPMNGLAVIHQNAVASGNALND